MALALHDQPLPQPPQAPASPVRRCTAGAVRRSASAVKSPALYVRRRVLAAGAVAAVGVVGAVAAAAVVHAAAAFLAPVPGVGSGGSAPAVVERTVQPGDTLWGVAESLPVGGDIRARVDALARLNGGSLLRAGDVMRIPASWTGKRS